jgi:hypothetical protein
LASEEPPGSAADHAVIVLIVHDDFGQSAVEGLLDHADCPRLLFAAYSCRQMPGTGAVAEWTRYRNDKHWSSVATSTDADLPRMLRRLVDTALDGRPDDRLDIFLITAAEQPQEAATQSHLADAVRRLRPTLRNPGLACVVLAGDIDPLTRSEGQGFDGLAALLNDFLEKHSFDFVLMAGAVGGKALHSAAAQSAANTIAALTYGSLAGRLRKKLSLGQFDTAYRAVSFGTATLQIGTAATRTHLRSMVVRRLGDVLLARINAPLGREDAADSQETGDDIEQQIASTGWELPRLRRWFARYRDAITARENVVLRDTIRDAGTAARAMAYLRVGRFGQMRRSRWMLLLWALIVGCVGGAIVGLVAAFSGQGPMPAQDALWLAAFLFVVAAALVGAAMIARRRAKKPPPDEREGLLAIRDNYDRLRGALRDIHLENAKVASRESNIDRSLQELQAALNQEPSPQLFVMNLPAAVCARFLHAVGVEDSALAEEFMNEHRSAAKLLAGDDPEELLHAIERFADQRLDRLGDIDWPDVVADLIQEEDIDRTWLGETIERLRRMSTPSIHAPGQTSWQIVGLPENTPDVLVAKLRSTLPPRTELVRAGADKLVVLQVVEGIRVAAPAAGFSPV